MKKIIILLLLISCYTKQGSKIVFSFENGNPKVIEFYKVFFSDTIIIKKQELYKNGSIKFQTEFAKNLSKCSSYLESGRMIEQKFFTNNQLDSIVKYDSNGIETVNYNFDH